jgi:small conductance mechanosensitive channel
MNRTAEALAATTLALLLSALFAIALAGPAFAQEAGTSPADAAGKNLDSLNAEIEGLRRAIADLAPRLDGSEGLEKRIVEARLAKARMELLERKLAFARAAAALEESDESYAARRQQAVEILDSQTDLMRQIAADIRGRIELPEAGASAAQQAAIYSRIFELLGELDDAYAIYIQGLELSNDFGIDVGNLEARIRQDIAERAATVSALLDISAADMTALRASLAAVPDDQEIKARLGVETNNVTRLAATLQEVLGLMENLDMDTSQYRQQLITVTGQITSDFFDVGVLSALVVGWGRTLWDGLVESGPGLVFKLILFFVLVYIFFKLASLAQRLTERAFANAQHQPSQLLQRMVLMIVRNAIIVIGMLVALAQIGISLGPLLAGLGVAGFIVGFALQETLSNFASGMMILIYRPFDVDDFVEAAGVSGKVSSMSLVNTTILTFDNQTIVVPNNKIWGDVIRNVTAQKTRRIDLVFGISYSDDIPKAERVLQEIVDSHEAVLDEPAPMIRLHELGDSSVNFIVRPWVKTDDYWETYWSMTRAVKLRFDEEGISIPFPQRDVHLHQTSTS